MIVSTIRQFGLRLCADPEEIPFQHSSNIQMQFIKDENYNDYTVVGYYIPPGENEAKLLSINDDGTFILGHDCFKQRGTLSFSFNLINSQEEIHLGSIDFEVRYAFGDCDTILPEPEEVWISLVTQVAKDAIKEDVALVKQKANEALQSASLANDKANEAQEYANNANQSANSASLSASSALTAKNDAIAASNSAIQAKQDAEQSANNAKNSANTALENANKSTEAIETVTQIKTEIENKANDFDTNYQEKLKSFNDNATSKQNAFDNSVQTANTNFDNKVTQANSDLDDKILGANNVIDEKILEATNQANEAKKQAQIATDEVAKVPNLIEGKLDKNLGSENADKVLVTDSQGNIATQNKEDIVTKVDNILKGEVNKSLNPIIDDSFKRELWNLKMYGKSTQITTTGANLINEFKTGILTDNQGNLGSLTSVYQTIWIELDIGKYTFWGNAKFRIVRICKDGGVLENKTDIIEANKPYNIEITQKNYLGISFRKEDNTAITDNDLFMLNKGAELLPYEPYSGGQPSPSPQYPQEITSIEKFDGAPTGKNLTYLELGSYSTTTLNKINDATRARIYNPLDIYNTVTLSINSGYQFFARTFLNGTYIQDKGWNTNQTLTYDGTFNQITVVVKKNDNSTITENDLANILFQIECGTKATDYIPYQGSQPFTYTPTQNMYSTLDGSICDYVDVEKGVEVYNMLQKQGSQLTNIMLQSVKENTVLIIIGKSNNGFKQDKYSCFCTEFQNRSGSISGQEDDSEFINTESSIYTIYINVNKTRLSTLDTQGAIEFINNSNLIISCASANPTETPIPQEQLAMLRALYTYNGVTNFLCNAPVSFTYERSLQIVINNLENAIGQTNANILLNGGNN